MIVPEGQLQNLTGKVKCTPEEALANWGFIMSPTAQGVIFRRYTYIDSCGHKRKGVFISNYNPPGNPQTPRQQEWRKKMEEAVTLWQKLPMETKRKWNQKAIPLRMSGFNLHNREYLRSRGQIPGPIP
jgi:hypothetical protein